MHALRHSGSSPLTRGKHGSSISDATARRLIPAHAGKTRSRPPCPASSQAHPRSRGENEHPAVAGGDEAGSSPLTRGKRIRAWCRRTRAGLIPAHAGKTTRPSMQPRVSWAHPRSRGENGAPGRGCIHGQGSSPLTRGKPRRVNGVTERLGLIPAHAGKTRVQDVKHAAAGAHPRSRGENSSIVSTTTLGQGSSPLTRGKHGPRHPCHP